MAAAFEMWAEGYDQQPNPLLELGERALEEALGDLAGLRVLDAGCGTGRWIRNARCAQGFGFDGEPAMLAKAPRGFVALASFGHAPIIPGAVDLVVASFSLSYAADPAVALADLCRTVRAGGRIAVADMAREAAAAGWRRTFRSEGRTIEIASQVQQLEQALEAPPKGWAPESSHTHSFTSADRPQFTAEHWREVEGVAAVRVSVWRRDPSPN